MFLAVFLLISALGSLLALRSNPMFSTRSSLRVGLSVLLLIAALVGTIAITVKFAITKSQPVALTIIFGAVIALTIAFILGIMKLTTPKVAAVPSPVPLHNFHRRKLAPWAKLWVWVMLAIGALMLTLPGISKGAAYALGIIVGFPGIVVLAALYYQARNQDLALRALEYKPWVHWQYSPTEWQDWNDVQVARVKANPPTFNLRRNWWKIVLIAAGLGVGMWVLGIPWVVSIIYMLGFLVMMFVIFLVINRREARAADILRAKMSRSAPEVYLGDEGIFSEGVLTPWISVNDWLLEAVVEEAAHRYLLLRFEKINVGSAPPSKIVRRVLLPPDASSDLARLQAELKNKCPEARISVS